LQTLHAETVERLAKRGAQVSRADFIHTTATITSVHGHLVKLKLANGHEIIGRKNGKLDQFLGTIGKKRRSVYLLAGDTCDIEMSPYDLTKCIIVRRHQTGRDTTTV
jgi:translation initiation factor IF-1